MRGSERGRESAGWPQTDEDTASSLATGLEVDDSA